ncbi:MAG: hypothetical protein FWH00_00415 [Oscillospiraceae bacterium]|nr:hypothetical protein [Oscillospiraceae bacterium]
MNTMQFRDFIFPHNPQSITIRSGNRVVSHLCPGHAESTQNLGGENRVVTCKGAFFGRSYTEAVSQLERFRAASANERPGLLFIPGLPPIHAHLKELAVEASGNGEILPYTMVFVEGNG